MAESSKKKHSYFHIALIVTAFLLFILLVTFHVLAAYSPNGLFVSIGSFDLYFQYPTEITPRGFTFSILGLVYWWQAFWLFYAFFTIFRHGAEGPLYRSPILLSPYFFFVYIIVLLLDIAWLFMWDRELLIGAFTTQIFVAFNLYVCIATSVTYLNGNLEVLTKNCLGAEKWWIWIGVQNGLALYATWATVRTSINFAIMLQYSASVHQTTAGSVALALLLAFFIIWSLVELIFLDRYSRYLFMPYVTIIWAFIGIVVGNFVSLSSLGNFILAYVGLSVVSLLGIAKLVVLLVKHYTIPLK